MAALAAVRLSLSLINAELFDSQYEFSEQIGRCNAPVLRIVFRFRFLQHSL